jgi:hypothetical protein
MVGNVVVAHDVPGFAGVITVVHHSVLCSFIPIGMCGIISTAAVFILLLDCLCCRAVPFREGASVVAPASSQVYA